MSDPAYIDRPPRIQPELPFGEVAIPKPPEIEPNSWMRLLQVALPVVTIVGFILVSTLGGGRNPLMIVPMVLAVVASIAFSVYTFRIERKQHLEAERAYTNRLVELNKEMRVSHDLQRRFYRYNYPDQAAAAVIIRQAQYQAQQPQHALRTVARLWERRTDDEDFGIVRLGVGTVPSTVTYVLGDVSARPGPLVRAATKLAADSLFVGDVPVIFSLRPPPEGDQTQLSAEQERPFQPPVVHALGIAGERPFIYGFTRALLMHYVVFHSPNDAQLFVLASKRDEWAWTNQLPHCREDELNRRRCFEGEVELRQGERFFDDDEGDQLEQFTEGLRKILAQRKIQLEDRDVGQARGDATLPLLLVVVDLLDATHDPDARLSTIATNAALAILLEQGAQLGAAVFFLVPERAKVPSRCRAVIEIEQTAPATNSRVVQNQHVHFRYSETGVNAPHYVGVADIIPTQAEAAALVADLATLSVRESSGATLANTVPFLDLMRFTSLADLLARSHKLWDASADPRHSNWMRATIGRMAGNQPRTLIFSAKKDGVHGVVAGSTGSGKSELLISLITGMAVTYHPSVLNFVLVDYKGGGAFAAFKDLPHCVDIITNLAADGVTRMFTAIGAEMRRRQQLNTQTGTKNIVEYRKKGLHVSQPYPFLFIIIDEFAEMIADRAEFKAELESITRVGRAQGVSLILAAQRPSGVTDQMRSNIKFRICLRVEGQSESREMLRRSDAAYLPTGIPGRGYLQVGNEEIELIQAAYTGDRYIDAQQAPTAAVIWPGRGGEVENDQPPPELYQVIITALQKQARAASISRQLPPWPNFLPQQLALSERLIDTDPTVPTVTSSKYLVGIEQILLGQPLEATLSLNPAINRWLNGTSGWFDELDWQSYALRPTIGLLDNPYAATQRPLIIDLTAGHVVVFGTSGSGKTTLIRTLITSLAASHSPDAFHAYVLDLGGRNLRVLAEFPHIAAVVNPDEEGYEERVEQILREVGDTVERRKLVLGEAQVEDILVYNRQHRSAPLPAILVAIDNFIEFVATFGAERDGVESTLSRLIALARQSKPYGVYFLITSAQLGALSSQVYNLFTERFALRMVDPADYRAIVGSSVPELGDIPGRGYTRIDGLPLSFQVALSIDLRREGTVEQASEIAELEQLALQMRRFVQHAEEQGRSYHLPRQIGSLPKSALFKQMLATAHGLPLDGSFLSSLALQSAADWRMSRAETAADQQAADWLKVAVGVIGGNRPRLLELEAKKSGVHGLIAGGTGSGKSELLMTLIVGLALRYDPAVLNFVLVDYKGGGTFVPFKDLPHVVDIVTNLNKAAVQRMFTAINAEMRRRQQLNTETGTKDIVEYRQRGLHIDRPYPHLFIIIDEYAEMILDSPEFGQALDSITRVGRAQGVNLLLASQRPTGVSDQMRANIRLRICLRVESADISRELLRRSDAAFLPSSMPGRGYLQIGNENIELTQIAWTGDEYEHTQPGEDGKQPKFYDLAVQLAQQLRGKQPRPQTPWPPALPPALAFDSQLSPHYFDRVANPLISLGDQNRPLALNPFLRNWIDGKGAWHGIDWEQYALKAVPGLIDDPYNARQLPLIVNFNQGHAVIFGASGWGKTTLLRAIVASLAATHSPDEFHAYILDLGGRALEKLGQLPHVGTVIMPDERGYEERVQQLLRRLGDEIDARKQLFSAAHAETLPAYNAKAARGEIARVLPAILLVVDNIAEFIETFGGGNADDENNMLSAFVALARQGKAFGLHVVITATRLNVLSSKLYSLFTERLALRLSDVGDYSSIVGANVPELEELAGRGYVRVGRLPLSFQVALLPGTLDDGGQVRGPSQSDQIMTIGAHMRRVVEQRAAQRSERYRLPISIGALPESSSYRSILAEEFAISAEDGRFLFELKQAVQNRWCANATAKQANWLRVVLGVVSGNQPRQLELEAKKDGVHGLIAGGTGSGKSELLMTLIVGLALNYSPDILNFVLVDYKGGGAFKPFERLPHVVDMVTNLNKAAVERMFTAIDAEIRRRQALNAATGTKDIVDYREKGFHRNGGQPYPHLFIIIDEYAEMISDNNEYLQQLESITRVGRAQGVNLLLASQQPKGVTDQMRANIKLRICLRVEQLDTSRELLRRPDAAFLPNDMPGRAYLQIGNENIELIQLSYTGEPQADDRPPAVLWPARAQRVVAQAEEETPHLFDLAVRIASELAGGRMAAKPWPAFLPDLFTLETVLADAQRNTQYTLAPIITDWLNGDRVDWPPSDWRSGTLETIAGLLDDPAEARQEPLQFDLSRSHLIVLGDAGMGKSTLLRTLLVGLAANNSPDRLHCYIIDLGGRTFGACEDLPHVGAVLYGDEDAFEEQLGRLITFLTATVAERQQLISAAGAANLYDYNAQSRDHALPPIVVLIDNFAELQENYESLVEARLLPLVRRSLNVGLTFVVTANVPTNLPSKLYSLFSERITFKQSNPDRYMDIVGRGALEIGDLPGRGYRRKDRRALMFQTALPLGLVLPDKHLATNEADQIRRLADHMCLAAEASDLKRWLPGPIAVLDEQVSLHQLLDQSTPARPGDLQAVIGLSENLAPALFDLKHSGPHFSIVGPPRSGKTTTLYNWMLSLASRYPATRVGFVLIDLQRKFVTYGGKQSFAQLPHTLACVFEVEALADVIKHLKEECLLLDTPGSDRGLFVFVDDLEELSEELTRQSGLSHDLVGLAKRYGRAGLHFVVSSTPGDSGGDLRKRIQTANFGLGLRTSQAIEALRVLRIPAAVRDAELPVGRGYIVKSGQTTLMQVANPYIDAAAPSRAEGESQAGRSAQALDAWVTSIRATHRGPMAAWSGQAAAKSTNGGLASAPQKHAHMLQLLQTGMLRDLERLKTHGSSANGHGVDSLIAAQLASRDALHWTDQATVLELLGEIYLKERAASHFPADIAQMLLKSFDPESLVRELEEIFKS